MKKYLILLILGLFTTTSCFAQKNVKNKTDNLNVKGVCEMCKKRIEKEALNIKGVKLAQWDIPSNNLKLIYDSRKVSLDSIAQSISQTGHDAGQYKAPKDVYAQLPLCCQYNSEENPHNMKNH